MGPLVQREIIRQRYVLLNPSGIKVDNKNWHDFVKAGLELELRLGTVDHKAEGAKLDPRSHTLVDDWISDEEGRCLRPPKVSWIRVDNPSRTGAARQGVHLATSPLNDLDRDERSVERLSRSSKRSTKSAPLPVSMDLDFAATPALSTSLRTEPVRGIRRRSTVVSREDGRISPRRSSSRKAEATSTETDRPLFTYPPSTLDNYPRCRVREIFPTRLTPRDALPPRPAPPYPVPISAEPIYDSTAFSWERLRRDDSQWAKQRRLHSVEIGRGSSTSTDPELSSSSSTTSLPAQRGLRHSRSRDRGPRGIRRCSVYGRDFLFSEGAGQEAQFPRLPNGPGRHVRDTSWAVPPREEYAYPESVEKGAEVTSGTFYCFLITLQQRRDLHEYPSVRVHRIKCNDKDMDDQAVFERLRQGYLSEKSMWYRVFSRILVKGVVDLELGRVSDDRALLSREDKLMQADAVLT